MKEIDEMMFKIGTNLRRIRKQKKLTQNELAFRCGNMDRSTISRLERFVCKGLNFTTLIVLAKELEIQIDELFK